MRSNTRRIQLMVSLTLLVLCISILHAENAVDFSSPQNTIKTYFDYYYDKDVLAKCFYPEQYSKKKNKWWLEYSIIKVVRSNKAGQTVYSGVVVNDSATEVIAEVKMDHPKKGNPKTKFWYLLQKVNNEWKIIDHSHIADKNYPRYD